MIKSENSSLLQHNTFGMDVNAKLFVEYTSVDELKRFLKEECDKSHVLHIGKGSNLLFTKDYDGIILHSAMTDCCVIDEDDKSVLVRVGAGMKWDDFVEYAVSNKWYGAENLSYIPGEVGSSAVQNIGAYGVEAKDIIYLVEAVALEDGHDRIFMNNECHYSYRESIFKKELKGKYIITNVVFKLKKEKSFSLEYGNVRGELERRGCEISLRNVRNVITDIRKSKLPEPSVQGNAGSFFMNPVVSVDKFEELFEQYPTMPHFKVGENQVKIPAAWLIDQCGWKGKTMGRAGVNALQPLVIVNCGGAKASEIITLAEAVCKSVHEKFGINISPEVNYI